MAQLNDAIVEDIRRKAKIDEVIGSYIPIIKAGRQFKAVCPFHDDHSPSMSINTDKQIYKCFVCGNGGNVFTFVKNYEQVSFPQAVKRVAEICHIDVDIDVNEEKTFIPEEKQILFKILNETINFCKYQLNTEKGQEVVNYLHGRGLDDEIIEYFNLGYNPEGNALYKYLSSKGYSDEDIIRSGVARLQSNGIVDVFDDRIMFPIHDPDGNPIAFSARNFSKEERAKYINTAQCELYTKAEVLYNANRVRKLSRRPKELFVVEGPLDVMALYRAGYPNAVATMGTAFTKEQAHMLKRLAPTIILCYDGDDPGQSANYKAGNILKEIGANFKVVQNKTGRDPDEIIKELGKNELQAMLEVPYTWIEFLFVYQLKKYNIDNYSDRKEFAKMMVGEIEGGSKLESDEFDKEYHLNRLASLTGFDKNQLMSLVRGTFNGVQSTSVTRNVRAKKLDPKDFNDMDIISQMMVSAKAAAMFEDKGYLSTPENPVLKGLALKIASYYQSHDCDHAEISDLLTEIEDENERNILFEIDENNLFTKEFNEALLKEEFEKIDNSYMKSEVERLEQEIATLTDPLAKAQLYQKIADVKSRRKG